MSAWLGWVWGGNHLTRLVAPQGGVPIFPNGTIYLGRGLTGLHIEFFSWACGTPKSHRTSSSQGQRADQEKNDFELCKRTTADAHTVETPEFSSSSLKHDAPLCCSGAMLAAPSTLLFSSLLVRITGSYRPFKGGKYCTFVVVMVHSHPLHHQVPMV